MRKHPLSSRRTLLKAAAGFGGSMLIGGIPFRAFAQTLTPSDRCFVFVYFEGGWDQLLAFDPRDPRVFTADRLPETRIFPGYSLLGNDPSLPQLPVTPAQRMGAPAPAITFGPAIGKLQNHYDLMAVLRGINMTTLSHEVGYRYFITGKEPAGSAARGSSTATEIVAQMKPTVPIPSIAYGIETYNESHPAAASALRVTRAADLLLTLAPSATPLDSEIEAALVDLRGKPVTCEAQLYDSRGLGTSYADAKNQMKTVISARLDQAFRFENNPMVRAAYGLPTVGPYDTPGGRAALVATALKQGISQCVSINLVGRLDTHFGTQTDHAQRLRSGFDAIADLVTDLRASPHPKGGNFMDHTTLVAFSEFSRTPLINGSGGRDHHLTNACLIMGAGFKHNVVYGHSGDIAMAPGVVDLATGLASPTGKNIFPEDVIATVLASAQLDFSITRAQPIRALLA